MNCVVKNWLSGDNGRQRLVQALNFPMDSDSTSQVMDSVDLGKFQAGQVFTANNAKTLAALATMVYSDVDDQRRVLAKQPAVENFQFLDTRNNQQGADTGTQVAVVETKDAVLVAARGTTPPGFAKEGAENQADWKDAAIDLAAFPTTNYLGTASVPWGFKNAADGIWGQLRPILETAKATHKQIHFSGHSLGAAVALMLAERSYVELGAMPVSVVRTGGPDCGWGAQKEYLEKIGLAERTFNFVNGQDPVPVVLPGGATPGTQIYFDRNGQADLDSGHHFIDRTIATVTTLINPLNNHAPTTYNQRLSMPKNQEILAKLEAVHKV